MIMFTFPYCPHLGRIFQWFLSLFCLLLFPVVFQPHLPTPFPLCCVLKLSLWTLFTFRNAFLILNVILICHCCPGKYLLALIQAREISLETASYCVSQSTW